jgi:hypothetical protein
LTSRTRIASSGGGDRVEVDAVGVEDRAQVDAQARGVFFGRIVTATGRRRRESAGQRDHLRQVELAAGGDLVRLGMADAFDDEDAARREVRDGDGDLGADQEARVAEPRAQLIRDLLRGAVEEVDRADDRQLDLARRRHRQLGGEVGLADHDDADLVADREPVGGRAVVRRGAGAEFDDP